MINDQTIRSTSKPGPDQTVRVTSKPGAIHYGVQGPDILTLSGYVCGFEDVERFGGPKEQGWIERVERDAFVKALAEAPDVFLLQNYEGLPLASTRAGTLKLWVDQIGFCVEATMSAADEPHGPTFARMEREPRDDVQWGFSFQVKDGQQWSPAPGHDNDDHSYRLITDFKLRDISIVAIAVDVTV